MLERSACFDVMSAFHIRHVRAKSRVRQFPLLSQRGGRAAGNRSGAVRKHVSGGVVIKPVLADETPEREQRRRADQAGPDWGDVKRLNLRTLVLRGQRSAGERVVHSDVQVVNRIRSLEPRTRVLKVRMDRIRAGYAVIDSATQVFLIALVLDGLQFRRVEK